jgi:hypothetical protein
VRAGRPDRGDRVARARVEDGVLVDQRTVEVECEGRDAAREGRR